MKFSIVSLNTQYSSIPAAYCQEPDHRDGWMPTQTCAQVDLSLCSPTVYYHSVLFLLICHMSIFHTHVVLSVNSSAPLVYFSAFYHSAFMIDLDILWGQILSPCFFLIFI